jgi:hypothetical protein
MIERLSGELVYAVKVFREVQAKRRLSMRWYHYVSYFWGGAFLANAVPHFVSGVTGHPFQSPFASPPGEGLSSAMVNVLWGSFNLAMAYLLLCRVGKFDLRQTRHVLVAGLGALLMAVMLAHAFGKFYGGVL